MKCKFLVLIVAVVLIGCGKTDEVVQKDVVKENLSEGYAQLADGNISMAIKNFDAAIQQNPTDSAAYIPLGELYLRMKNYTAAVDTFNAAAKVNPADGQAQYFLALSSMLKSQIEGAQGRPEEMQYYKDKAITAGKQSAEIFLQAKDEERFKKAVAVVKSLMDEPVSP